MNEKKIYYWNIVLRLLFSPIRFFLNMYLASCLTPDIYGEFVMPSFIVSLSLPILDMGYQAAMIQTRNLGNETVGSLITFNLIKSNLILLTLILINHFIFFLESRWFIFIAIILFLKSFSLIYESILQVKNNYKALNSIEFISYLVGYLIGIEIAKRGGKIYSLFFFQVITNIFYTGLLISLIKIQLKLPNFSMYFIKSNWQFAKYVFSASYVEFLNQKIEEPFLVKYIPGGRLGIYAKAKEIVNIIGIMGSKLFSRPWFSIMSNYKVTSKRNDKEIKNNFEVKYNLLYQILVGISLVNVILFFFYGDSLVKLLLGIKWISMYKYLKVFLISSSLYFLIVLSKYTLLVFGRSKLNFLLEAIYTVVKIILITFVIFIMKPSDTILYIILVDIISKSLHLILILLIISINFSLEVKTPIVDLLLINLLTISILFNIKYISILILIFFISFSSYLIKRGRFYVRDTIY